MRTDRTDRIAAAVARQLGLPDLPARLAGLDASPLGSLLLAVFRARACRLAARDIRTAHEHRGLHQPSSVEARLFHRADAAALEAAEGFEALDPSPVLPLGACTALGGTDPNSVLLALRGAEVLADPTIALALEAARRRREPSARRGAPVRLCASASSTGPLRPAAGRRGPSRREAAPGTACSRRGRPASSRPRPGSGG